MDPYRLYTEIGPKLIKDLRLNSRKLEEKIGNTSGHWSGQMLLGYKQKNICKNAKKPQMASHQTKPSAQRNQEQSE